MSNFDRKLNRNIKKENNKGFSLNDLNSIESKLLSSKSKRNSLINSPLVSMILDKNKGIVLIVLVLFLFFFVSAILSYLLAFRII